MSRPRSSWSEGVAGCGCASPSFSADWSTYRGAAMQCGMSVPMSCRALRKDPMVTTSRPPTRAMQRIGGSELGDGKAQPDQTSRYSKDHECTRDVPDPIPLKAQPDPRSGPNTEQQRCGV